MAVFRIVHIRVSDGKLAGVSRTSGQRAVARKARTKAGMVEEAVEGIKDHVRPFKGVRETERLDDIQW